MVHTEAGEFYAPIVAENLFTAALMPHYYLASTVLSNGVYLLFKDSGYNEAEAFAQLMADHVAIQYETPSKEIKVDDRYFLSLT